MKEATRVRFKAVEQADTRNFVELVRLSGLNPLMSFRYGNLNGADFSDCDLTGFNFFGSTLSGAIFKNAHIDGAIFDHKQIFLRELKEALDYKEFVYSRRGEIFRIVHDGSFNFREMSADRENGIQDTLLDGVVSGDIELDSAAQMYSTVMRDDTETRLILERIVRLAERKNPNRVVGEDLLIMLEESQKDSSA